MVSLSCDSQGAAFTSRNNAANGLRGRFRAFARGFQVKRAFGVSSETPLGGGETRCLPNPPTIQAPQSQRALRAGRMSNIVLYEENDLMRALLQEWLSEAGYRVYTAASHDLMGGRLADLAIVSVYMPKHVGAQ